MRSQAVARVASALVAVAILWPGDGSRAATKAARARGTTPTRTAAGLQARVDALLAAGKVADATRLVPDLIAAQTAAHAADTVQLAGVLNRAGAGFFGAGPEGAPAAESLFVHVLRLREARFGPRHPDVAKSCNMLSVFHTALGQYDRATEYKRRALDIRIATFGPRDTLVARTEHEFGVLDVARGHYRDAAPHFEAALGVFGSPPFPDSTRLADLLNDIGELRRIEARYAAAESCYRRSLAIGARRFLPDDAWFAEPTNNLAGLYRDQGRYAEAEPLLERSWKLRATAAPPDSGALATAALNLAELYRLQDRPEDASPRYDEALRIARGALGADHPDLVWFLNQAAVYEAERGAPERAEPLYRESIAILRRAGGPAMLEAQTEDDLADLLQSRRRYAAAESLYVRALATREDVLGPRHPDVALTLIGLGRCVHAGDTRRDAEALRSFDRAAVILDATHAEPEARVDVYAARARVQAERGAVPDAIASMAVALDQIETLRPQRGTGEAARVRFLARHANDADAMVDWCLQQGDVERAVEVVERGRARAFLDRVAAAPLDPLASVPVATRAPQEARVAAARLRLGEIQQQIALASERGDTNAEERRRRLAGLEADLDASAVELQRAQDALLGTSPVWRAALAGAGTHVSAADIARRVPRGGMLLLYQVGAASSHVIAIPPPPGRPEAWPLEVSQALALRWGVPAGALRGASLDHVLGQEPVGREPGGDVTLALRGSRLRGIGALAPSDAPQAESQTPTALYDLWCTLLPRPLWQRLAHADEIVVVPDGALCALPFEALVVEPPDPKRAPRYWLDAGPVVRYALSGASLVATPPRRAGGATLLSVSDPAYDARGPFPRLPATARETDALRAAFGKNAIVTLSGGAATEPAVRAALGGKRYLHLATHGVVDRRHDEMLAGLVLAAPAAPTADTGADGMLQLFEIYDLRLDCELAVLSACETSAGAYVEGEGVYALSRGFLAAGAREVVASLWAVEDESTAALVGELFGTIAAAERGGHDVDAARALRDAKRHLRARPEWSAPFFWAPFVLTARD